MTDAGLTISFADSTHTGADINRVFVRLEQVEHNEQQDTVTMYDIQQMVSRARNGMSAVTYKAPGCQAYIEDGTLVANFDFYAWPSSPSLIYTVTAGMGNITDPVIVQKNVEFSVTFELSDTVELDFILKELTNYRWETACYDSDGRVVDDVTLKMDGYTTLRASAPIFGVVRIRAIKRGAQHTLTTRMVKTQQVEPTEEEFNDSAAGRYMTYYDFMGMYWHQTNIDQWIDEERARQVSQEKVNYTGLKLTNLQISVTAHWMDDGEEKTDRIILEVPGCVKDLLEACGKDTDGDGIIDDWSNTEEVLIGDDQKFCGGGEDPPMNVYISGCTGEELLVIKPKQDKNSWCGNG